MRFVSAATVGRILTPALCLSIASPGLALAQDATPARKLHLELNAMQPSEKGCRITFLVKNGLGASLEKSGFEIVLFDKKGQVSRIAVLDFQDLPEGKTKVRQFDFAGTDCADLSRVLINSATECKGEGISPKACTENLETESKAGTEFGL